MYEETFIKYVVVVVLFAVFLLLANVWHYQNRGRLQLHSQRRRRRRRPQPARVSAPEVEPAPRPSFWSRALPWLSIVALLVCIAALAVMWYAMGLAAVQGGG